MKLARHIGRFLIRGENVCPYVHLLGCIVAHVYENIAIRDLRGIDNIICEQLFVLWERLRAIVLDGGLGSCGLQNDNIQ